MCAVGAAISAGVAINVFEDESDGVEKLVRKEKVFYPIEKNVRIYRDIYKNVYKKVYKTTGSINETLSKYAKV